MKDYFKAARITDVLLPILNETCVYPKQLKVREEWRGEDNVKIIVTPCMADASTLIGKGARIVNAYKYIVKAAGLIVGIEAEFVLENDHHGDEQGERPEDFDYHFDSVKPLIEPLCELLFGKTEITSNEEAGTIYVYINPHGAADVKLIWAVSDVVYPIGYRRSKIKVKPANLTTKLLLPNENTPARKGEVLGGKRKRSAKLIPR